MQYAKNQPEVTIPAKGSLRDWIDCGTYRLQRYDHGLWSDVVRFELGDPKVTARFLNWLYKTVPNEEWPFPSIEEVEQKKANPLPPHRAWPFPTKPQEPKKDPYEAAKEATKHL